MVIREILKKAADILKEKGIEDSYNEAAVLFASAADKSKTYIFTHMDEIQEAKTLIRFNDYIDKRSRNMPVAYITGKAWFMSLELYVDDSTLIPRPETEGLVEEALRFANDSKGKQINVLDLCTGSGCVGISIAYYNKNITATLSDINPECIKIAEKNISKHNVKNRVTTAVSDLYQSLNNLKFDIIIVNPPYIPSEDIAYLDDDVRLFEPLLALDGGVDGLDFYRKIAVGTKIHLKDQGRLFIEIGINQQEAVMKIFQENGFSNIETKNDISDIPRIVTIC